MESPAAKYEIFTTKVEYKTKNGSKKEKGKRGKKKKGIVSNYPWKVVSVMSPCWQVLSNFFPIETGGFGLAVKFLCGCL